MAESARANERVLQQAPRHQHPRPGRSPAGARAAPAGGARQRRAGAGGGSRRWLPVADACGRGRHAVLPARQSYRCAPARRAVQRVRGCLHAQAALRGLGELHEQHGVLHRDVKSSNLLLTDDAHRLKVGDLGLRRMDIAGSCPHWTTRSCILRPRSWRQGCGPESRTCSPLAWSCASFSAVPSRTTTTRRRSSPPGSCGGSHRCAATTHSCPCGRRATCAGLSERRRTGSR